MDSYDSPLLVDSGVATPTLHFSDYLSRAHVEKLQASLSNSTSSETLHSPSKHVSGLSSPRSHSDDGVISNPSSGTSTPPLALAGTQHISNSLLSPLATPATLSASTSIQSLSSIASCSTSKRKAVPRRSLSMSESLGDPDIVKLEVYELFRKQPKRLLEEPEAPPPPQERRSEDRFESSSSGSMRRVNSLPQMTTLSSKEAAHDMDYSTSSQGGNGGAVQPRKRFYQKRTASPVDEEMDGGGYHMRLPPMIDTGVGYRDTGAEQIHSPLLASARSPRLPDSQNPLSPTTSYRDYSDADDDTIAAARELGSLKIFANSSHYEDGSAVPSSKRNRRGSSSSRKPPRGLNGRSASVESERGNALPPLPETWNEENGAEDMDENGSSAIRVVNRSNYPPVSGRGSEGAFQTTQHMPKGQIRSVLIKDRFRDTAGKNVAHWKC